ncbi:MAG: hypothetical protein Fur0041_12080 [Bacteroidia bacterium]
MRVFWFLLFSIFITYAHARHLEQWVIDSAVTDGIRQIGQHRASLYAKDNCNIHATWMASPSAVITIDYQKWCPAPMDEHSFYYRMERNVALPLYTSDVQIADPVDSFNLQYFNHQEYIPFYVIHLVNFPFVLSRPVGNAEHVGDGSLYSTLMNTGALKQSDWNTAWNDFHYIISTIAGNAATQFQFSKVIAYGAATAVGNYNSRPNSRASFFLQYVYGHQLSADDQQWFSTAITLPKLLTPKQVEDANLQHKKNACSIINYIRCNHYGHCSTDNLYLSNRQANWFYQSLSQNPAVNKVKLLNTALHLNALSEKSAWCILTLGNEEAVTDASGPLSNLYPTYDSIFLNKVFNISRKALRGIAQLKTNNNLARDSVLYYGWLFYRDDDLIRSISTVQRVSLIQILVSATCQDVQSIAEATNPSKHCERICLSLIKNVDAAEQKNLLDLLRSRKVLGDLFGGIDNSTFGFFGANNYTDVVLTLAQYWKNSNSSFVGASTASAYSPLVFKWSESFFNLNSFVLTNYSSNVITVSQSFRGNFVSAITTPPVLLDVYAPVLIVPTDNSEILGVPSGTAVPAPAFFLDWLTHIKSIKDLETGSAAAIQLMALASGVGQMITATSWAMRGVAILEAGIAASDLVLMNQTARTSIIGQFATQQEGEAFLQSYQQLSMIINSVTASYGLVSGFGATCSEYAAKFNQRKAALQNALGTGSSEYKALEKLEEKIREGKVVEVVYGAYEFGIYSTRIDHSVKILQKETLFGNDHLTFLNAEYRTVETIQQITTYRSFGGNGLATFDWTLS